MPADFTLPPDTRTVGQGNPPADMNGVVDALTAMGAALNAFNAAYATGAKGDGTTDDTAALQAALNAATAGQVVTLPQGTYKTTSVLTVPNGVTVQGPGRTMAIPTGNYGIGGVPLQGAIIAPSGNVTAAIQFASNASVQYGNQSLRRITINGAGMTSGTGHGILADAVAGITLEDVAVVNVIGDGLHGAGVAGTGFHPPDFWEVTRCKFSACGGWGVSIAGLADSWFTDCESTGNTTGAWTVTNGGNTRFTTCKGEQNGTGAGWSFTAQTAFTGQVHLDGCTSQNNKTDGYKITGSAAPNAVYKLTGCASLGDGINAGTGGGGYAGLNVTSFAGTVIAPGFACQVNTTTTSPQYAISMTSSGVLVTDASLLNGQTQAVFNGGGNTALVAGQFAQFNGAQHISSLNAHDPSDTGLIAESYDHYTISSAQSVALPTTAQIWLIRVDIRSPVTVTGVRTALLANGSGLTASQSFVGLYNSAGTLLGLSADQSTNWGAGAPKPVDSPLTVQGGQSLTINPGFYWIGIVSNWTTTGPAFPQAGFFSGQAAIANGRTTAATSRVATNGTGTTLAAITPSSNVAQTRAFWAAIY